MKLTQSLPGAYLDFPTTLTVVAMPLSIGTLRPAELEIDELKAG